MIIDFSNAVEGEFYTIDEHIDLDDSLTGSRGGRIINPSVLSGWYVFSEDTLSVSAELEFSAEFCCDRCLTPVIKKFKVPVSESFFKERMDEDTLIYTDEQVDIQPIIDERVLLAMPSQVLCKSDCRGLCDKCGANLNEVECNCNIIDRNAGNDSPFSVLKNMNIKSGGATNGSTKK